MNAISSAIYDIYKNGTVDDLINAMEATYSRYCDPIVLAMEAMEANEAFGSVKDTVKNAHVNAIGAGYQIGQTLEKKVKAFIAWLYSIYRKVKDFITETIRKLTRARGTHIYASRASILEDMCDISRDYIKTISDMSLLDRTRGEFSKKLDSYRQEFEEAVKKLDAPITDADKKSGVLKAEICIAMTRSKLQALDAACSSALVMAKKMEASAIGDEDGLKKINFVKTYAAHGATMANRCINAINKIIRTTEKDTKKAEAALKNSDTYKENEKREKEVARDAKKSQNYLNHQQKKEEAKAKRAQARAKSAKIGKRAEATT